MKYHLSEKYILTESATVPSRDWEALFREAESKGKLSDETLNAEGLTDIEGNMTAQDLWELYYDEEWAKGGPFTNANEAKARLTGLGDAFKTEVRALGFNAAANPFLTYLNNNVKNSLLTKPIYSTIHNAAVENMLDKEHIRAAQISNGTDLMNLLNYNDFYNTNRSTTDLYNYLRLINVTLPRAWDTARFKDSDLTKLDSAAVGKILNASNKNKLLQIGGIEELKKFLTDTTVAKGDLRAPFTPLTTLDSFIKNALSASTAPKKDLEELKDIDLSKLDKATAIKLGAYLITTYGGGLLKNTDIVDLSRKLMGDDSTLPGLKPAELAKFTEVYGKDKVKISTKAGLTNIIDAIVNKFKPATVGA